MSDDVRQTAHFTDAGPRASNQDAVVVKVWPDGRELVAVADGMGGHQAGEVASRTALDVLVTELGAGADLRAGVQAANTAVLAESERNPDWAGMGTTLVALLRTGSRYYVANVGDSRAYRIGPREIEQLTADHTFVAEAIRTGGMSQEEAARSPWRNALTRAVGTDAQVEVDVFGPFSAQEPHVVLLCSDGLYKTLSDDAIARRIHAEGADREALRGLGEMALDAGSDDNVTIAAVAFGALGAWPAPGHAAEAAGAESTTDTSPSARPAVPPRAGPMLVYAAGGAVDGDDAASGGAAAETAAGGAPNAVAPAGPPEPHAALVGGDEADASAADPAARKRRRYSVERRWMRYEIVFIVLLVVAVIGYVLLLTFL